MGAVTRDTFTVVNDPLIRLDKKLGPTGFYPGGKTNIPRILKDLFLGLLLQKIDSHQRFASVVGSLFSPIERRKKTVFSAPRNICFS